MDRPATMNAWRISAITLVCIMLGACSTTQKSSTSTGSVEEEQAAAPVTEAGAAPADSSAPSTSASAPSTPGAEQELPEFPPTPIESQDQIEARQQLAEQEAEITRLREEQAESRQAEADEAARLDQLDQPATAQSQSSQPGAGPSTAAPSTAAPSSSAPSTAAPSTAAPSSASPAAGAAASTAGESDQPPIGQPLETSVYFDFDRTTVSGEYDAVVAANAAYLKANPNLKVTIQGNCDERGSREYNLALGQRRAEMVKRALELSGVDGGRIDTVSFGSEKPVAFGKDEESYRQNRRADIIY